MKYKRNLKEGGKETAKHTQGFWWGDIPLTTLDGLIGQILESRIDFFFFNVFQHVLEVQ